MNNDLISRQAAIVFIKTIPYIKEHPNMGELMKEWIEQIPGGQPKTGRWIYTNTIGGMRYYGCTICTNQEKDCIADENEIQWYNYCPNCGAKMESENKKT